MFDMAKDFFDFGSREVSGTLGSPAEANMSAESPFTLRLSPSILFLFSHFLALPEALYDTMCQKRSPMPFIFTQPCTSVSQHSLGITLWTRKPEPIGQALGQLGRITWDACNTSDIWTFERLGTHKTRWTLLDLFHWSIWCKITLIWFWIILIFI